MGGGGRDWGTRKEGRSSADQRAGWRGPTRSCAVPMMMSSYRVHFLRYTTSHPTPTRTKARLLCPVRPVVVVLKLLTPKYPIVPPPPPFSISTSPTPLTPTPNNSHAPTRDRCRGGQDQAACGRRLGRLVEHRHGQRHVRRPSSKPQQHHHGGLCNQQQQQQHQNRGRAVDAWGGGDCGCGYQHHRRGGVQPPSSSSMGHRRRRRRRPQLLQSRQVGAAPIPRSISPSQSRFFLRIPHPESNHHPK